MVGVTPDLLGCGQENEQVDNAVFQGAEVLQGKGGDVLPGLDSFLQSASPPPTSECKGHQAEVQCTREPALSEPVLMEGAGYQLREGWSLPGCHMSL